MCTSRMIKELLLLDFLLFIPFLNVHLLAAVVVAAAVVLLVKYVVLALKLLMTNPTCWKQTPTTQQCHLQYQVRRFVAHPQATLPLHATHLKHHRSTLILPMKISLLLDPLGPTYSIHSNSNNNSNSTAGSYGMYRSVKATTNRVHLFVPCPFFPHKRVLLVFGKFSSRRRGKKDSAKHLKTYHSFRTNAQSDKCRPCPLGAICPGGFRATSFPGYYTVSSAAGIVVRCPRPALERCIGFNETTQQTVCGKFSSRRRGEKDSAKQSHMSLLLLI